MGRAVFLILLSSTSWLAQSADDNAPREYKWQWKSNTGWRSYPQGVSLGMESEYETRQGDLDGHIFVTSAGEYQIERTGTGWQQVGIPRDPSLPRIREVRRVRADLWAREPRAADPIPTPPKPPAPVHVHHHHTPTPVTTSKSKSNSTLIIVIAAGGGAAVLVAIIVIYCMCKSTPEPRAATRDVEKAAHVQPAVQHHQPALRPQLQCHQPALRPQPQFTNSHFQHQAPNHPVQPIHHPTYQQQQQYPAI